MAPFSISCALAAIDNEDLRCSTRATIEKLSDTMRMMGYGYGVREDSRLAFNWAYGTVSCDLIDVTEELSFIQWLSETTIYQVAVEKELRKIANAIKGDYPELSWVDVWSVVRVYGPDIVRYAVLDMAHPTGVPALTSFEIQSGCGPDLVRYAVPTVEHLPGTLPIHMF